MNATPKRAVAGRVVIVTRASAGIGQATARAFARPGARVVLAARRAERLEALKRDIEAAGGTALAVPTDVTDRGQIARQVQAALEAFGRIDVLANIAGWGRYDWLEELSSDDLRQQYEVNVIGMAEVTRQVLPTMKSQRSGIILNMSSYASRIAVPPLTVYASTEYAVDGLSDGLRRELQPWGIAVVRIHPSAVTGTEFNRQAGAQGGVPYRSLPIGRVSREQVAQALVKLVERPQRALFMSRLYAPAVVVNRLFPGVVDGISSLWVRRKRQRELGTATPAVPVRYMPSGGLLPGALRPVPLLLLVFGLVAARRRLRSRPR